MAADVGGGDPGVMRVSAKTDYALRALLVLAERSPAYVKAEALIAAEDLPRKFVESILSELRRAGLVTRRRGAEGGYGLAVPAEAVTVGAVIRVLDGPIATGPPTRPAGVGRAARAGGPDPSARLTQVWTAASASVSSVLDATTLAHLLSGQLPEHVRRLAEDA